MHRATPVTAYQPPNSDSQSAWSISQPPDRPATSSDLASMLASWLAGWLAPLSQHTAANSSSDAHCRIFRGVRRLTWYYRRSSRSTQRPGVTDSWIRAGMCAGGRSARSNGRPRADGSDNKTQTASGRCSAARLPASLFWTRTRFQSFLRGLG